MTKEQSTSIRNLWGEGVFFFKTVQQIEHIQAEMSEQNNFLAKRSKPAIK
jgi:hypothetical protein